MAQTKVQLLQPDLGDVIDFDASTLFVDGADNRIGIRNTNPQYELDVTGTVNATNFRGNISVGTIDDWITHTGDTNTKFGFPAADQFQVLTSGNERLTIDSNGKLLIGEITTPFSTTGYRKVQIGQADGGWINLARTGVPADGNHLGAIQGFAKGADGTYHPTVAIDYKADGTPSNTSKPSKIEFYTTPSSSTTRKERFRIHADGSITQNYGNPDASAVFRISKNGAGAAELRFDTATNNTASLYLGDDEQLRIRYGGTEVVRFRSDGDVHIGPSANANGHGLLTLSQAASAAFNALVIQQGNTAFTATDGLQIGIDAGVHAYIKQYENRDIYFTTGNPNTEKLRLISAGKLLLHGQDATGANNTATILNNGNTLSIHGTSSSDGISVVRYSANYGAYGINIGKSRNNTFGTNTLVQDGNELGHISFYGADGTDFEMAAQITAVVDGDPATGGDGTDMPGALSFRTTDDGSATPTEKLRIDKNGMVHIKGTNHATRYFRDDGNRYGSIFYDGGNFNIKSPQNDHTQITNWGGTVLAKFNNDTTTEIPGGVVQLGTANSSSGHLSAYENMTFNIDTDNDDTNRTFKWYHNAASGGGTELASLDEGGSFGVKGNSISVRATAVNSYNSSWAVASGTIAMRGDLGGGNYFGWRQKGVASGSVTQANAEKKLPTLNDFTYPNSSNGMLIASTSKIGFSASGESPQYSTGVRMLFDGDLGLGSSNAYDCNDSVLSSTTTNLILRGGNGRIGFHMAGNAPAQAIHINGGTQTSNRGIYGDWDYGSSTSGQSGANYMLLEDKRWRINRGNPLIHLYAYNNSENSNGSGAYTSRVMKIDMNTAYTQEVNNDKMYGLEINCNTTNVNQVRALKTNGNVDTVALYLNDYHMAERYGSDSGNKEWGHWRGCIGGNNAWNGDNRSPRPHDFARGRGMACFFTQKNGNSSGNYMDAMHFSTYSDWSGGNPNLFMINKSNNNVRVIRGAWDASNDMDDQTYNNYIIYDLDYTSGSDLRLKEDINTIASNNALSLVTQLRPVTFKWKDEYINSGFSKNEKENEYTEEEPLTEGGPKRQVRKTIPSADKVVNVGLIAQEVESVIPTVVHDGHVGLQDEDGANYKNIDYDKLVPYLIGAIKELKSENDALKSRVTALES